MRNYNASVVAGLVVFFILLVVFIILLDNDIAFLGVILAIVGGGLTFWAGIALTDKADERAAEKARRAQEAEEAEKARLREQEYASGNWRFPAVRFYKECRDNGVSELDSNYALKKAEQLAKTFLPKDLLASRSLSLYWTPQKVRQYFEEGREKEERRSAKLAEAPQTGILSEENKEKNTLYKRLAKLKGTQKREAWLSHDIEKISKRIKEIEDARGKLFQLGGIMVASAYQEPTRDWATAGGIASAIGGPVAGIAEASRVMAENAQIEERNKRNKEAVSRQVANMIMSTSASTVDLSEARDVLWEESAQLEKKIVVEEGLHLFDHLSTYKSVKVVDSKSENASYNTQVTVSFSNQYESETAQKTPLVMDGTLRAKIYCGKVLVDTVYVPLPQFGVPCGGRADITVVTPKYMAREIGKYSVDLAPVYLCIMDR